MAVISIHDIIAPESAKMWFDFMGMDGTSYKDVRSMVAAMGDDDNDIILDIDCKGGDVAEGWKIYDELRASGKSVSAEIVGECSSMATIILLAASADKRSARPHAQLLIHAPMFDGAHMANADDLEAMAAELRREEQRMLDVYQERTGADREVLEALMRQGDFITAQRALELGFISNIIQPISALNMTANEFLRKVAVALGVSTIAMELTTADGETIELKKDEGKPAVGDEVVNTPDGSYLMPDGETIVVTDGKITEIIPAAEETPAEEPVTVAEDADPVSDPDEDEDGDDDDEENEPTPTPPATESTDRTVKELEAENERLRKEIERMKNGERVAREMSDMVTLCGGMDWLKSQASTAKIDEAAKVAASQPANEPTGWEKALANARKH